MKAFGILCLVLAAAWVTEAAVPTAKKQLDVLHLLHKVNEPINSAYSNLRKAAEHFKPTADKSQYKDGGDAAEALCKDVEEKHILKQHHWFSLFNDQHRHEAIMLFEVLNNCKTWDCAINNAAYFRERMNEGVFVYALYVTVVHHPAANDVVLPPLYEITPHMFANTEVIQHAYSAKMQQTPGKFHMSFTGSKKNPEQRVAYFGEDIGLGVHHVTWHMDFPFWWEDKYGHHFDRKGELFFWVHHQLTARFDAERLSNHLNIVDELYWDHPIEEGFAPQTTYKYGGEFPARPDHIDFEDVEGVARVRDMIIMETRIRDAIAHGYVVDREGGKIDIRNENGINILGDIIESSKYSPNAQYYGALHNVAHIMLGRQGDPHGKFNQPPGVMEHFETATRDPAFFRLHKYMDNLFKEHKDTLPPYKNNELYFPGVSVESVSVSGKLETFFEDFEFNLENAVDDSESVPDVKISAIVSRLNHEPFSMHFDITNNNDKQVLGTVRVYICPRKDHNGIVLSLEEGRWGCIEIDKFWETLSPGSNHVVRKSTETSTTVPDVPSYHELLEKTEAAIKSGKDLDLHEYSRACGIPNRLLIPKGTTEGMEFALFVAVSDGSKDVAIQGGIEHLEHTGTHAQCGIHGEKYPDARPLGFPLDRRIAHGNSELKYHNLYKGVVTIFHNEHPEHHDHN